MLPLDHPTEQDSPFNPILLTKAQGRAKEAEGLLQRMMRGERPDLASTYSRGSKWLMRRTEIASAEGSLPGHPTQYYSLPEPEMKMGFNAAPSSLISAASDINDSLSQDDIHARVLGTDRHLSMPQIKTLQRTSDLLIATPGDLKADFELVEVVRRKLDGAQTKPLIIENTENQLDPLLANLQFLEYNGTAESGEKRLFIDLEKLAKTYGIYITHTRAETLELAHTLGAAQKAAGNVTEHVAPEPLVPEEATIFVATATRKKFQEINALYEKQGLKVNILPIDRLVDSFISPKEESNSYEGNAAEKIQAAFDAWNNMSPQTKVERLKDLGQRLCDMGLRGNNAPLKEEEIFFLAEDSGFHFVQTNPNNGLNLTTEREFAGISNRIHADAPFPGVETGPGILGDYGVQNFFGKVDRILKRYEAAGHPVTRDVIKKSILALAPLQPEPGTYDANNSGKAKKIIMYAAQTKAKFTGAPRPPTGPMEIDNFLEPEPNQTEAELGREWHVTKSPRALAWSALVADQNIAKAPHIERKPLREKDFHVGIVSDKSHEVARAAIEKLVALNRLPEFTVDELSADIRRLSDVQNNMLEGKDAVVLAFDPERAKTDFWRNVWTFSSLIVGEQTRDKYKLEKPLYLVNPKDDEQKGPFDYLEKLTHDLHILGTVGQDPKTLYHSVNSAEEAVDGLKKDRDRYLRYNPPAHSKGPKIKPKGDESPKDFNVVVFVSATNENTMIHNTSKKLTTLLAQNNFGVYSGAGMYSGMGTITKTMVDIRDEHAAHHTGFNVPHIMDAGEVKGRNITELVDRFHLCRDIYERIEGLLSADAAIMAPGGMGTVQELAGYAVLKEMALREPDNDYVKGFADKELVIINTQIQVGGERRGFYDKLLQTIPAGNLKKLGIHVVDTPEEAVAKMQELRAQKLAHSGKGASSAHAHH
ncbi:MAG: hypothetical protein SFT92_08655 [Rickettsiales bacterium]|nr:hypothetical protein [Rickettsiales bacterium]